jgi:predicted ArsR family transcriptional regulator
MNEMYKYQRMTGLERDLLTILRDGPLSRDQIVKIKKIPRSTIYDNLKKLINAGLVVKYPRHRDDMKRGRPKVLFELRGDDDE